MNSNQKVAILCWVYNTEKWQEIKKLLEPIQAQISFFCGVCLETCSKEDYSDIEKFCIETEGEIKNFENVGADVNSFLYQISHIDKEKYPVFIKIHSKTELLTIRYIIPWFSYHIDSLIGSKGIFYNNIKELETNKKCGMIGNDMVLLEDFEHTNGEKIQTILTELNIDQDKLPKRAFIGGNMFASKTDIFQKYFNDNFYQKIYQKFLEASNTEKVGDMEGGTYPHALERVFGYIMEYNNLEIHEAKNQKIYTIKEPFLQLVRLYDDHVYLKNFPVLWGKMNTTELEDACYVQWRQGGTMQLQKFKLTEKNRTLEHYV